MEPGVNNTHTVARPAARLRRTPATLVASLLRGYGLARVSVAVNASSPQFADGRFAKCGMTAAAPLIPSQKAAVKAAVYEGDELWGAFGTACALRGAVTRRPMLW